MSEVKENSHVRDNTYGTCMSITITYIRPMQIYNGTYIEVCHSEQGDFGHKTVNLEAQKIKEFKG